MDDKKRLLEVAQKVMAMARDTIAVNLRFLDVALSALGTIPKYDIKEKGALTGGGMATDGEYLYYDPVWVLKTYMEEPEKVARTYLHLMLHLVFFHPFEYGRLESTYWDLASDIAVEAVILSMDKPEFILKGDAVARDILKALKRSTGTLTAEKVYRYLQTNGISESGKIEWFVNFHKDEHIYFKPKKEISVILERWQKISERVKTDIKNFSKEGRNIEELDLSLKDATRERYDYKALLNRFMSIHEDVRINDDEFDYIYYTYGMDLLGNMPLIEPLEYRDSKKIRDFAIVIDTSASTKGDTVKAFLNKTYNILSQTESFFTKVCIHIIMCDNEVRSDTRITNNEEFLNYTENLTLKGFGSTDFRPPFRYVEELRKKGEFDDLRGLIYFTDGYGIYPEQMPDYSVLFAFLKEDEYAPEIPVWAYKVVLPPEELESEEDL